MEQRMKQLEFMQIAQKKLADARGMELQEQHPQLTAFNPGPQTTKEQRGGGMEGLKRVIGAGKAKKMVAEKKQEMSPAFKQGSMLAAHLQKLHGGAFMKEFLDGWHSHGGQDVPPGAVAPIALGSAPEAPESFRNANPPQFATKGDYASEQVVGGAMCGGAAKPKRAPNARAQAMGKLMREKKMSMAEASRYLKEHGY